MYAVLAFLLLDYTWWSLKVIDQFCTHLGIECLRIPVRQHKTQVAHPENPPAVPPKRQAGRNKAVDAAYDAVEKMTTRASSRLAKFLPKLKRRKSTRLG